MIERLFLVVHLYHCTGETERRAEADVVQQQLYPWDFIMLEIEAFCAS